MRDMTTPSWFPELEGLRGLAALWVFAMHVGILSGTNIPLISKGAYGVDLFILLSGFLMAHQYERRSQDEPWASRKAFGHFWTRRFFRIAPLYYLLLAIALPLGPYLGRQRLAIAIHFPATMTDAARYSSVTIGAVATHVSFLFGAIPSYSFATPLPDWSIGLEMQFYFVFPFLMVAVAQFGYLKTIWATLFCVGIGSLLGSHFYHSFPMPSFLPLRLHLFLLGMLLAAAIHGKAKRGLWLSLVAIPIFGRIAHVSSTQGIITDVAFAVLLLVLAEKKRYSTPVLIPLRRLLDTKPMQTLGSISYSLYLVHLLLVLPICAELLNRPQFANFGGYLRFILAFGLSAALIVPASLLLHRLVELPFASLGKRLLKKSDAAKKTHHIRETIQKV